jgi:hypothetical protein
MGFSCYYNYWHVVRSHPQLFIFISRREQKLISVSPSFSRVLGYNLFHPHALPLSNCPVNSVCRNSSYIDCFSPRQIYSVLYSCSSAFKQNCSVLSAPTMDPTWHCLSSLNTLLYIYIHVQLFVAWYGTNPENRNVN